MEFVKSLTYIHDILHGLVVHTIIKPFPVLVFECCDRSIIPSCHSALAFSITDIVRLKTSHPLAPKIVPTVTTSCAKSRAALPDATAVPS